MDMLARGPLILWERLDSNFHYVVVPVITDMLRERMDSLTIADMMERRRKVQNRSRAT